MTEPHPIERRNPEGDGGFLFVCEHASNHFPARFGQLGLSEAERSAHIAWDPGALGVARGLSDLLQSPLAAAGVSRLIYDCNRPPDQASAMPARSETYDIPGNQAITSDERLARTEAVYLPFQAALTGQLARMLARGQRPILVTVHSFTPLWFGQKREVEFGIIHDQDARFAEALESAAAEDGRLRVALNQPYSGADGVAHTLRLHATPHGLPHAMLEFRNDLIASPSAEAEMAEWLAPLLRQAAARLL